MKADRTVAPSSQEAKTVTPTRACPRCPRCRGYVWTLVKNSFAGRFKGVEVCVACLAALILLEVS